MNTTSFGWGLPSGVVAVCSGAQAASASTAAMAKTRRTMSSSFGCFVAARHRESLLIGAARLGKSLTLHSAIAIRSAA
jgi:hypothetical protein